MHRSDGDSDHVTLDRRSQNEEDRFQHSGAGVYYSVLACVRRENKHYVEYYSSGNECGTDRCHRYKHCIGFSIERQLNVHFDDNC